MIFLRIFFKKGWPGQRRFMAASLHRPLVLNTNWELFLPYIFSPGKLKFAYSPIIAKR